MKPPLHADAAGLILERGTAVPLTAKHPEEHLGETAGMTHAQAPDDLLVPVKVEEIIAAILMGLLALITFANVVTRYVVDASLAFTEEYSVVLLMMLVFVGVSSAIAKDSHIRVTFFTDYLKGTPKNVLDIVASLAMIVCFAVLVYYGTQITLDARELSEESPGLGNPMWLYLMWLPILSVVAALRSAGVLMRQWRKLAGRG